MLKLGMLMVVVLFGLMTVPVAYAFDLPGKTKDKTPDNSSSTDNKSGNQKQDAPKEKVDMVAKFGLHHRPGPAPT